MFSRGLFTIFASFGALSLAGQIDIITLGGDPMPDGNGSVTENNSRIQAPALNNQGLVLFYTEVENSLPSSPGALLLGTPSATAVVAREKQPESILFGIGVEEFTNLGGNLLYALGDQGLTGFITNVMNGGDVLLNSGFTPTGYKLHIASGYFSPDEGSLGFLITPGFQMNEMGQVVQLFTLSGTDGGNTDNLGIIRYDLDPMQAISIAQKGDPLPVSLGNYTPKSAAPSINSLGQVAFQADVTGTTNTSAEVVLRGDGNTLVEMIGSGMLLPGGGTVENFGSSTGVALNTNGHVAVYVENSLGNGGNSLVIASSPGSFTEVARIGQLTGTGEHTFSGLDREPILNNLGDLVFIANLISTTGGGNGQGLFKNKDPIFINETMVPDNSGVFWNVDFATVALNNRGDLVALLEVNLTDGPRVDALFTYQVDGGIEEIIRVGDTLAGGTVTGLEFSGTAPGDSYDVVPNERNGFNDRGQVAFQFTVDGDFNGIAIWSPEPLPYPGSSPARIFRHVSGGYEIQFPGLPGIAYQFESRTSLTTGAWATLGNAIFPSPEGVLSILISDVISELFVRCVFAD